IAAEDPFLQTADDMSFFVHGDGTFLKLDQDGRITVTDFIREHTGITSEVALAGRGHCSQICGPERVRVDGAEVRARLPRLRQAAAARRSAGNADRWRARAAKAQPVADRPATFRFFSMRCSPRPARSSARPSSTARSAPAAIRPR